MLRLDPGDCRDVLAGLAWAGETFDACITDPPYDLTSVVKRFGGENAAPAQHGTDGLFARQSRGFMGKTWDGTGIAFDPATWRAVWDVLKPGAHLLAFGGTRTFHRMAVAIEDAGFEIRDTMMYMYGSGFPKSHSVSKGIGGAACECETPEPAPQHVVRSVRNPDVSAKVDVDDERGEVLQPCLPEQGTSADGSCPPAGGSGAPEWSVESFLEGRGDVSETPGKLRERSLREMPSGACSDVESRRVCDGASARDGFVGTSPVVENGVRSPPGPQPAKQRSRKPRAVARQSKSQAGGAWPVCNRCGKPRVASGWGTALKPAWEPIIVARKPLIGTVAANVLAHGTGALNIDGCRVELPDGDSLHDGLTGDYARIDTGAVDASWGFKRVDRAPGLGRWPANVLHDGSDEIEAAFAAYGESKSTAGRKQTAKAGTNALGDFTGRPDAVVGHSDSGTAARFFYSAKAGARDRAGSKHPTVKPIALMRYLCRLVTPPGGTVLDPFGGSGSTLQGAAEEGFSAVTIEREPEYQADILRRIASLTEAEAFSIEEFCA